NRLGSLPIQPEVAAGDGKIGGHGQLLIGADAKQRAVVADAETQPAMSDAVGELRCPCADLLQHGQLARLAGMDLLATRWHVLQDRVRRLRSGTKSGIGAIPGNPSRARASDAKGVTINAAAPRGLISIW